MKQFSQPFILLLTLERGYYLNPYGLPETHLARSKSLQKFCPTEAELEVLVLEVLKDSNFSDLPIIKAPDLGEILKAKVIALREDYYTLDFGYKSEGYLPSSEEDNHSNADLDVGDVLEVMVDHITNDDTYWFSKKAVEEHYQKQAFLSGLLVGQRLTGTVENQSRGGLLLSLFPGLIGKLPLNQSGIHPAALEAEDLLGKELEVEILSLSGEDVELTRKQIVEEAKKQAKESFLTNLEPGLILDGTVKSVADFGLFIQIAPGVVGLCHNSDKSEETYNPGQRIKAKVLRFDRAKNRVSLGIRQVSEPTWDSITQTYCVGTKVRGEIKSLVAYGAFVELEPGIQGMIHVSDLSWSEHIKHPKELLEVGEKVEVVVLELDSTKQRIHLGLKQTKPDPWDNLESKYLVGSTVSGKVTSRTDFGTFVALEEGVEGLLQERNLKLHSGSAVKVKITRLDAKSRRIGLTLASN